MDLNGILMGSESQWDLNGIIDVDIFFGRFGRNIFCGEICFIALYRKTIPFLDVVGGSTPEGCFSGSAVVVLYYPTSQDTVECCD